MSSETWQRVPLADLVEDGRRISYGIVQPGQPSPEGVPIVRVGDVRNGTIGTDSPLQVAPEIEACYERTRLRGGELLLTLVGTVGESAVVPAELAGWNVARAIAVIPVRSDVGANWVQIALSDPFVRRLIAERVNTTVQATLNLADVAQLPVVLPARGERERIERTLGAMADKAAHNETFARHLQELLMLEIERLDYSGVDDEALSATARFVNGRAFTKEATGDGRPILRIKELNNGISDSTPRAELDARSDNVAGAGDLLFSWSGSLDVYRWSGVEGLINQHIFKVVPRDDLPLWLVEAWLRQYLPAFRAIAADKATTMGHIQRRHLDEARVLIPSTDALSANRQYLDAVDRLRMELLVEARHLRELHDALLPELIGGRLNPTFCGSAASVA